MLIALEDAFTKVKNKFVYPTGYMTATSKTQPVRYVHRCDRKHDCDCIKLTCFLIHGMSNDLLNDKWAEDLQAKLELFI